MSVVRFRQGPPRTSFTQRPLMQVGVVVSGVRSPRVRSISGTRKQTATVGEVSPNRPIVHCPSPILVQKLKRSACSARRPSHRGAQLRAAREPNFGEPPGKLNIMSRSSTSALLRRQLAQCCILFALKRLFARITFCRMSRAVAVQINGFGFALWCATYCSMAVVSSGTLVNTPRRRRFSEISRKNRSTMVNRDAEVGVKWILKRRCFVSHACTFGCLCVA